MDLQILEMLPTWPRALYSICSEGTVVSESLESNPAISTSQFYELGKITRPLEASFSPSVKYRRKKKPLLMWIM